jgi:hypothetical protein
MFAGELKRFCHPYSIAVFCFQAAVFMIDVYGSLKTRQAARLPFAAI